MKLLLLLLGSLALGVCYHPIDNEAASRQVLEKESATWRAGDVAGHAACWHPQPYSLILISTAEGQVLDVPPVLMTGVSPAMGQGGPAVNSKYKLHVAGSAAWVSNDEESTAKDGRKTSSEFRVLEKFDDQWRLVGQSVRTYKR